MTLFAFRGESAPWDLSAWWAGPNSWRYLKRSPATTSVEYVAVKDRWSYRVNGIPKAQSSDASRGRQAQWPSFDAGNANLSPQENCRYWAWLNPQLWVECMDLHVLWQGSIRDRDVYHVVAWPNANAGRRGLGLFNPMRGEEALQGHIYQLWVDQSTGFFHRITAEADNGRAWDIIVTKLVLNQPLEESVFG